MSDKYTRPEFPVSRIRYYDGLFLTDQDFIDEQNYHTALQMRGQRQLHTPGITEGLDVTIGSGGSTVAISAGSALDAKGRQILLATQTSVAVDALWNNGARYLEVTFNEVETGVADQNSAVAAATRFTQSPAFSLKASRTEGAIVLASVAIVGGIAVSVDTSGRAYSGVRLPAPTGASAIELASSNDGATAVLTGKLNVDGAASLDSTLDVAGATELGSTLSVTGNTALATASGSALTVAGATTINNTLGVTGNTTLGGTATITGATKVNNTFESTGNTTLANGASSTLTVTGATTLSSDLALTGDRTINFNSTSTGKILFNSKVNSGSDKAFILFKEDSDYVVSDWENSRLSIGIYNDFGHSAVHADAMDLQGGTQLTLNVGAWDSELNAAIGTPGTGSYLKGISFRVSNAEKMLLSSAGFAVSAPTTVSGTLETTGNTKLASATGSTLTVSGASTVNNTLEATGNTKLATGTGSTLTVTGASTINNTLETTGNTKLATGTGSTLIVTGASTINNTLETTGNTKLATGTGSTLTVTGASTINNTLETTGNTKLATGTGSTLAVTGAATINNTLETTGNTKLATSTGSTLTITGAATINNTLETTGNTKLATGTNSTLTVTGAATINNTLETTGNTKLATGMSKTLTVSGATTINNTLETTGNTKLATTSGSTLTVSGASTVNNTFEATGNTKLATATGSTLTVSGASTFSSDITVSGARTVTFDNASTAKLLFKSSSNALNDWGYILFQSDSSFVDSIFDTADSSAENARLSIGVRNDYANLANSKPADAVDIQGAAQLTLNAGKWDTELDSLIGSQWSETGMGSTNGISFRIDNTEKMRLSTSALTVSTDMVLSGTRTLTFDNAPQGLIVFNSSVNPNSDKAFILFKQDSVEHGTSTENVRLSIGVFNDFTTVNSDALDLQGGYKLKLNAGDWDDELDTAIGAPNVNSTVYGISLCVGNTEKMKVTSGGVSVTSPLSVSSGQAVSGVSVVAIYELTYHISNQSGTWYETAQTATFTQDVASACPAISSYYIYYTASREYVRYTGVETWYTIDGKNVNVTCRVHLRDNSGNYDDSFSGWVRLVVIATLKAAV